MISVACLESGTMFGLHIFIFPAMGPKRVVPSGPFGNVYVGVKHIALIQLLDSHHGEHPLTVSILPGITPFFPLFYAIWSTPRVGLTPIRVHIVNGSIYFPGIRPFPPSFSPFGQQAV